MNRNNWHHNKQQQWNAVYAITAMHNSLVSAQLILYDFTPLIRKHGIIENHLHVCAVHRSNQQNSSLNHFFPKLQCLARIQKIYKWRVAWLYCSIPQYVCWWSCTNNAHECEDCIQICWTIWSNWWYTEVNPKKRTIADIIWAQGAIYSEFGLDQTWNVS